MACRSMICNRKHFVLSNNDNNDIIHYSEFLKIVTCLVEERQEICQDCGVCLECKNLIKIINRFLKMNFDIRQMPNLYVKLVEFNKKELIVECYYSKTYEKFEDAVKDKIL